jgi:hypothetical protein
MEKVHGILCVLGLMAAVFLTSGCGARFIHAKTVEVSNAFCLHPANDPVGLVRGDESLPIDQQVKAQELRDMSTEFYAEKEKDLDIFGDLDAQFTIRMLAVSKNQNVSTYPTPTEFQIVTSSPHSKGETTQNGSVEIRFGNSSKVFTTDRPTGTFFELEISDIYQERGDWMASGIFSMIARNKNDSADTTRFFVMDGAFVTKIRNH